MHVLIWFLPIRPTIQYRAQNVEGLKNHKDVVTEFEFDGFDSEEDYLEFLEQVLVECFRVCKPGAAGYLWLWRRFCCRISTAWLSVSGFSSGK